MERVNWVSRALTFAVVIAVVLAAAYFLSKGGNEGAPRQTATAPKAGSGTAPATTATAAPKSAAAPTAVTKGAPGQTAAASAAPGRTLANGPAVPPTTDPFIDQTVLMSQAFGIEMISRRLTLLERYTMSAPLIRQVRKMPNVDFARFHGGLRARDPQLADDFYATLWATIELAANGGDIGPGMAKARGQLATTRDALINPAFQRTTAYKAALAVDLLLSGDGVAEAFEEAFRDPAEYPNGWIALQRVKQLWAEIEPSGNETAKAEGRAALAALDGLYASQVPPATMAATGHTAEDAEAAAQRLAGVIEQVAQINLFPGRDLPALADHLTGLIGKACVAYDAGEDYIGQETTYAAGHHYGQQLTGLVGVLNPILNAGIVELLGKLVSVDDLMDEPPELIAARNAKRRGPLLDADDDDGPQTEPGWLFCPDLESLMKRAATTVRG